MSKPTKVIAKVSAKVPPEESNKASKPAPESTKKMTLAKWHNLLKLAEDSGGPLYELKQRFQAWQDEQKRLAAPPKNLRAPKLVVKKGDHFLLVFESARYEVYECVRLDAKKGPELRELNAVGERRFYLSGFSQPDAAAILPYSEGLERILLLIQRLNLIGRNANLLRVEPHLRSIANEVLMWAKSLSQDGQADEREVAALDRKLWPDKPNENKKAKKE